jgi:hypothetical protein
MWALNFPFFHLCFSFFSVLSMFFFRFGAGWRCLMRPDTALISVCVCVCERGRVCASVSVCVVVVGWGVLICSLMRFDTVYVCVCLCVSGCAWIQIRCLTRLDSALLHTHTHMVPTICICDDDNNNNKNNNNNRNRAPDADAGAGGIRVGSAGSAAHVSRRR